VVKDPMGNVVKDVSFRVVKTAQYSRLKARIRNGVLEDRAGGCAHAGFSWGETNRGEALFQKGRVRLVKQGRRPVGPGGRLPRLA
jgi:hypothetical protein